MSWLIVILVGMLTTRFLEAMVPLFMKTAIDSLEAREPNLFWPVVGILTVVGIRFCLSIFTSRLVRRIGIVTAYDLKKRLSQ